MNKLLLFILLITSCATDPYIIGEVIRKCLFSAQVYVYDIDRDEEAHEDRIMKCSKKILMESPTFNLLSKYDKVRDVVFFDCPDGGMVLLPEDWHSMKSCVIGGMASVKVWED